MAQNTFVSSNDIKATVSPFSMFKGETEINLFPLYKGAKFTKVQFALNEGHVTRDEINIILHALSVLKYFTVRQFVELNMLEETLDKITHKPAVLLERLAKLGVLTAYSSSGANLRYYSAGVLARRLISEDSVTFYRDLKPGMPSISQLKRILVCNQAMLAIIKSLGISDLSSVSPKHNCAIKHDDGTPIVRIPSCFEYDGRLIAITAFRNVSMTSNRDFDTYVSSKLDRFEAAFKSGNLPESIKTVQFIVLFENNEDLEKYAPKLKKCFSDIVDVYCTTDLDSLHLTYEILEKEFTGVYGKKTSKPSLFKCLFSISGTK
ncbi:MAG: hypothetical protein IKA82_01275 [Clostridia bacterium]|nr:hypothetical protein [Clostridia bacterium]